MLMDKIGATKERRPHSLLGHSSQGARDHSVPAPGFLTSGVVRAQAPVLWQMHRERCPLPSLSHRSSLGKVWGESARRWSRGSASLQHPRRHTHSPPAFVRLLGVATPGVAEGTVLREEAPGSVGHLGGAPGTAPRLAGLLRSPRLRVAVNALLHRHGSGALRILLRAQAPA